MLKPSFIPHFCSHERLSFWQAFVKMGKNVRVFKGENIISRITSAIHFLDEIGMQTLV